MDRNTVHFLWKKCKLFIYRLEKLALLCYNQLITKKENPVCVMIPYGIKFAVPC